MIKNLNRNFEKNKSVQSYSTNAYKDAQNSIQSFKISEQPFQDVSKLMHKAPQLKDEMEIENINPDGLNHSIKSKSRHSVSKNSKIEDIEHEISHRIPCLFLESPEPTNLFVIYFHSNGEDLNDGSFLAAHINTTFNVSSV